MVKTILEGDHVVESELYLKRAQLVLPILVRQAEARAPITYGDLATELKMPFPLNLNYPLGSIGKTLNVLSSAWGNKIPPIQALVVKKSEGIPGHGFDVFLEERGFAGLDKRKKRKALEGYWAEIYGYPYWDEVLKECGLQRVRADIAGILERASGRGGAGEGADHLALKEYVYRNPGVAAFDKGRPEGKLEHRLPSADRVDVLFRTASRVKAVEVKSHRSDEADIARGLFQCVKYKAILEAEARSLQKDLEISVCLILGGKLPRKLISLKNCLAIEVIENVTPQAAK